METKKILVIGGGGVKGQIAAKNLLRFGYVDYDVYIGTSVGAIIAAARALGIPAWNIMKDFPVVVKRIFGHKKIFGAPQYSLENAIRVLDDYFGHKTTADLKARLVITSTDLVRDTTEYPKAEDYNMSVARFVALSFCAPYYFETIVDEKERTVWSDGGVGYNNLPVMGGIMESMKFEGYKVVIHAFGTGIVVKDVEQEYERLRKTKWIRALGDFISIKTGGFARKSSTKEQVNAGLYWASHSIHEFVYFDSYLKKDIALDDYKAIQPDKLIHEPFEVRGFRE